MHIRNLIIILFAFLVASPAGAATLYLDPASGALGPGSVMAVDVLIDVEECVNAVETDLAFPKERLQLKDFIVGESILSLWVKQPDQEAIAKANQEGILNFIGGIPGGYCGRLAGDAGARSNKLARLIFAVPAELQVQDSSSVDLSFLSTTKALLNDGFGTADKLVLKSGSYILGKDVVNLDDSWSKEIDADTIQPEPFVIELRRRADMFDNQYYIIFNTLDKQSGMDHYEVLEIRPDAEIGVITELSWWQKLLGQEKKIAEWKQAKTPYLLYDQELLSTIRVKAVDKAGNERFVEYIPETPRKFIQADSSAWLAFGALGLIFLVIIVFVVKIFKKIIIRKKYDKEKDS
jgi:hypothetical protein